MSATWHTFCTPEKKVSVPELGLKQFSNPHHHATFLVVGMSATWHTFCTAEKKVSVPELGLKQFSNPHHHATCFTLFFIFKKELYQVKLFKNS